MTDRRIEGRAAMGSPALPTLQVPARVARQAELRVLAAVAGPPSNPEKPVGLECRDCGCTHWHTIQTRQRPKFIYRQKKCRHCGKVVSTSERIVSG